MGMDALTTAAFDSLVKDALPKLQKRLAEIGRLPPERRQADESLRSLISEAQELLALLATWSAGGELPAVPPPVPPEVVPGR